MASTERLRRLLRLLELLQSGQLYNAAQLAEESGVSRRTIYRDLALLQKSGLELRYDEQRQGYVLPPRTFLPPAELTFDETLALLNLCAHQRNAETGIPFRQSARSAALKLLSNLPARLRSELENLPESIIVRQDAHNPLTGAGGDYELVLSAFRERRQVQLRYQSLFERREIETVLKPYCIFFERRSWYAIGRSSLHRSIRTFNIGRIVRAELLDSRYRVPRWFNLDTHLGHAWRFMRGKRRHRVAVRFSKLVAQNVAEVRWHKTQQVLWNDDGTILFRASVDGLDEILWWILGYGDQAEVLAPDELREDLKRRVEAMRRMYSRKPAR